MYRPSCVLDQLLNFVLLRRVCSVHNSNVFHPITLQPIFDNSTVLMVFFECNGLLPLPAFLVSYGTYFIMPITISDVNPAETVTIKRNSKCKSTSILVLSDLTIYHFSVFHVRNTVQFFIGIQRISVD